MTQTTPETNPDKLKLGLYWAASCGGCEIAVLEIGDRIITLMEHADILFWPCVVDFKYDDVRAMPDNYLDVVFFNGGIRTDEHQEIAHLLRKKAKTLVAFGSCAIGGGIPALANFYDIEDLKHLVYEEGPSIENPDGVYPQLKYPVPEGHIDLPKLHKTVKPLKMVVDVDYSIPGCPPVADRIWECIMAIIEAKLPKAGSIIGAGTKSVCDECPFPKKDKKITRFYRPYEKKPEPDWCLLEQGIVCMGPVTRNGCGALCLKANMPCRGCYGPVEGAEDQGAAIIAAIGSILDTGDDEEAARMIDQIVDPAGTFYRFGLGASILRKTEQ